MDQDVSGVGNYLAWGQQWVLDVDEWADQVVH